MKGWYEVFGGGKTEDADGVRYKLWQKVALTFGALVFSCMALELALRLHDPFGVTEGWDRSEEPTPPVSLFNGRLIEGTANSLGLRDVEYNLHKTTGAYF